MATQRITLALALSVASAAPAGPSLVSYRFGDLSADYTLFDSKEPDPLRGNLVVAAVASATHSSNGDISRLDDKPGTGEFDPGFAQNPPFAVRLDIDVTNISPAGALGTGFLSITDGNGDTLTADITGVFNIAAGFVFLDGITGNYTFNAADGAFDGTTGSIDVSDLVGTLFDGSISLLINAPGGLDTAFTDATANLDGNLIPAPAAGAVFAGLGLLHGRRRRADA